MISFCFLISNKADVLEPKVALIGPCLWMVGFGLLGISRGACKQTKTPELLKKGSIKRNNTYSRFFPLKTFKF